MSIILPANNEYNVAQCKEAIVNNARHGTMITLIVGINDGGTLCIQSGLSTPQLKELLETVLKRIDEQIITPHIEL